MLHKEEKFKSLTTVKNKRNQVVSINMNVSGGNTPSVHVQIRIDISFMILS